MGSGVQPLPEITGQIVILPSGAQRLTTIKWSDTQEYAFCDGTLFAHTHILLWTERMSHFWNLGQLLV